MTLFNWSERKAKQKSREYVLEDYCQQHAAIFMPGWDEKSNQSGQDIRTGLAMRALDTSKPLYVVERDPDMAAKIAADLRGLGFTNLIVHADELHTLVLHHKVDFAFIDLLGALDQNVCEWMRDTLAPAMVNGATFALTMAYSRRNNHFMAECERIYETDFGPFTSDIRQKVMVNGHHKLVPILLIRGIFQNHTFAYRRLMKYRDSNFSMLTYRFDDFQRKGYTNGSPSLAQIVERLQPVDPKARVDVALDEEDDIVVELPEDDDAFSKRSRAALKAWETRRHQGWVHPTHRSASPDQEHQRSASR